MPSGLKPSMAKCAREPTAEEPPHQKGPPEKSGFVAGQVIKQADLAIYPLYKVALDDLFKLREERISVMKTEDWILVAKFTRIVIGRVNSLNRKIKKGWTVQTDGPYCVPSPVVFKKFKALTEVPSPSNLNWLKLAARVVSEAQSVSPSEGEEGEITGSRRRTAADKVKEAA